MSTTMQIQERGSGWVLTNHDKPVAVDKRIEWEDRTSLVSAIEARGKYVHGDGSVQSEPEVVTEWSEPVEETKPAPVAVKRPRQSGKNTEQKAAVAAQKAAVTEPKRRGRPPKYTPEEAAERRKEQARNYSKNRTEEQKAAARERAKRWREKNPDKVKELREKSGKARAERYAEDEAYREKFNAYQRDYKRTKRADGSGEE